MSICQKWISSINKKSLSLFCAGESRSFYLAKCSASDSSFVWRLLGSLSPRYHRDCESLKYARVIVRMASQHFFCVTLLLTWLIHLQLFLICRLLQGISLSNGRNPMLYLFSNLGIKTWKLPPDFYTLYYLEGDSLESNLLHYCEHMSKSSNNHIQIDLINTHFSKATS